MPTVPRRHAQAAAPRQAVRVTVHHPTAVAARRAPPTIEPRPVPPAIEPHPVPPAIEPRPVPPAIEPRPVPPAIEPRRVSPLIAPRLSRDPILLIGCLSSNSLCLAFSFPLSSAICFEFCRSLLSIISIVLASISPHLCFPGFFATLL
jgi:hypothetical protein